MQEFPVGPLVFEFGGDWKIGRPDEWAFYRKQFAAMWDGIRAVDLLALDPTGTLWLIEVKRYDLEATQYPRHPRKRAQPFGEVIGTKAFATLALLLPARLRASDAAERELSFASLGARQVRVVFHLEQPRRHSKLFPRVFDLADVQQKMRTRLKAMDPHPLAVDSDSRGRVPWTVRRKRPSTD